MSDGPELSDEQVEFLNTVFDLVRAGDAVTVADYVGRGLPPEPGIVEALLDAGADPALGSPDARATAAYFQLPAMTAVLSPS